MENLKLIAEVDVEEIETIPMIISVVPNIIWDAPYGLYKGSIFQDGILYSSEAEKFDDCISSLAVDFAISTGKRVQIILSSPVECECECV